MPLRLPRSDTRTCPSCRRDLPATAEHFYPRPARPCGFHPRCRECQRAKDRRSYRGRPRLDPPRERPCVKCQRVYPATIEFYPRNPKKRDGLCSFCRGCNRERAKIRQRKRRADPTERLRVQEEKKRYSLSDKGRKWKRVRSRIDNHRRQKRTRSRPFCWSVADWERCQAAWGYSCAYCGRIGSGLTQDHFIPVSDPSSPGTVPGNMVPACPSCNYSKQHRNPDRWCSDVQRLHAIRAYLDRLS